MARILLSSVALSAAVLVVVLVLSLMEISDIESTVLQTSIELEERARSDSAAALTDLSAAFLGQLALDQASIASKMLDRIQDEARSMASFAMRVWREAPQMEDRIERNPVFDAAEEASSISVGLALGVSPEVVASEANLLRRMEDIFMPICQGNENLTWAYLGTESGITVRYPRAGSVDPEYDPRARPWYGAAKDAPDTVWTPPYTDAWGSGLMVTCAMAVRTSTGELLGVVGVDVTLGNMAAQIISTQLGERGYAFMLDQTGRILGCSAASGHEVFWGDGEEQASLLDNADVSIGALAQQMVEGSTGVAEFRESYVAYAPVPATGWSIGVVMPSAEISEPASAAAESIHGGLGIAQEQAQSSFVQSRSRGIMVGCVLLVAACLSSAAVARSISQPISRLTQAAKALEHGFLDENEIRILRAMKGGSEVAILSHAFANMAERVGVRVRQLQRQVERLHISIDEKKKDHDVQRITESDYFKDLRNTARTLRRENVED